ncbi:ABC transporter permease [Limosilactobacillus mucosae]|uniref:ABC transporter permease n=1 Tax=Limosilactobacillus mucosae TaxID=97478 RepID=UPI00087E4102|nr:ABC transporter permease [Limosilactobacillus mucosae]SDN10259.1 multidrug/hemolysin transport system permease protein [Limosilactobacillus mucosae]SEK63500.1 multidrug/hemolysin transport system permease protein [Limosilactobacillus mucosae]SFK03030.1 multidrug/hemolysin transport system permease protein [Limosilactobacillus mucosae]
MKIMVKRNLKIYFQDKAAVFFSMLSVIIIFALYIFFIGDSISSGLKFLPHPNRLMRAWMLAGMLASASITTSLGAYGVMISDRENKTIKDFYSSPVSRRQIAGGYIITGFIISIIMSIFTLIFGEIYMGMIGGAVLDMDILLKLFGVIVLSAFASSAIASFIISFLKTNSAYSAASMIVGTLIGFLVGAYIPIGNLPENVQWLVKYFPCAHSAVLYRQLLMEGSIKENFANQPTAVLKETKEILGVVFVYNGHTAPAWMSVAALLITGVVFYLLAVLVLIRKENEI